MSTVKDIINVSITRETKTISKAGFGTILIVGPNATFENRINYYSSLSAIAAVLGETPTTELEYLAAQAIFSQSPRVTQVAIGRWDVGDADYGETLDAILLESKDFYGVILADRTLVTQKTVVDWVQANERVAAFASDEAEIIEETLAEDVTSLAWYINSEGADRSICFYSAAAATDFVDAAFLGKIFPLTPGGYTGMFKTLAGVPVDLLTETPSKNAHDKFCSTFETIGGVNIVFGGWVGSGEYIDIIIFFDWLTARITEAVFYNLVNEPKVPYTDEGILSVKQATEKVLKLGQDNGGISPTSFDTTQKPAVQNGGYIVTAPLASSISSVDKALRTLEDVEFIAYLAGAIHTVSINGTLTY